MELIKIPIEQITWHWWETLKYKDQLDRFNTFIKNLMNDVKAIYRKDGSEDQGYKETRNLFDNIRSKGKIENYILVDNKNPYGQYPAEIGNQRVTVLKANVLPNIMEVDCRIIPKDKTWRDVIDKYPYKKVEGFRTPPWINN